MAIAVAIQHDQVLRERKGGRERESGERERERGEHMYMKVTRDSTSAIAVHHKSLGLYLITLQALVLRKLWHVVN